MSFGMQAYCEGIEVVYSGDEPCRLLCDVGLFTSVGTHFVACERRSGTLLWQPYSRFADPSAGYNSPVMHVTNVVEATGGVNVTVASSNSGKNVLISPYNGRALVYEWR